MTNLKKITKLMQTLVPANIELGLLLAEGNEPDFRAWFEDRVTELLTTEEAALDYMLYELTPNDFNTPFDWYDYKRLAPKDSNYTFSGVAFFKIIVNHIWAMEYGSICYLNKCTCSLKLPYCNIKSDCLPF
jgi:hypothetical protein